MKNEGSSLVERALLNTTQCSWQDRELSLHLRGLTPMQTAFQVSVGKTAVPAVHKGYLTLGSQDPTGLRTEMLIMHS